MWGIERIGPPVVRRRIAKVVEKGREFGDIVEKLIGAYLSFRFDLGALGELGGFGIRYMGMEARRDRLEAMDGRAYKRT